MFHIFYTSTNYLKVSGKLMKHFSVSISLLVLLSFDGTWNLLKKPYSILSRAPTFCACTTHPRLNQTCIFLTFYDNIIACACFWWFACYLLFIKKNFQTILLRLWTNKIRRINFFWRISMRKETSAYQEWKNSFCRSSTNAFGIA